MYDYIYQQSLQRAKHKIWILSDLQQRNPDFAKECLTICMDDYEQMNHPADMIWYLGDAVEGNNRNHLLDMCEMQENAFAKTGIPLCYTIGNHDFDYCLSDEHRTESIFLPFYEMVQQHNGWHTTSHYTEPYFKVPMGDFMICFFCDHIAENRSWIVTHGKVNGDSTSYPHMDTLEKIRQEICETKSPVITASHYSFAGGNRASGYLSKLLPLPGNVKIHFYGHAHIGDFDWAKENAYRRIAWVDWHDIPQINVSSFEHIRGKTCRSVFLHIYEDNSFGIFFRNHDAHAFSECYFPAKENHTAFHEAPIFLH